MPFMTELKLAKLKDQLLFELDGISSKTYTSKSISEYPVDLRVLRSIFDNLKRDGYVDIGNLGGREGFEVWLMPSGQLRISGSDNFENDLISENSKQRKSWWDRIINNSNKIAGPLISSLALAFAVYNYFNISPIDDEVVGLKTQIGELNRRLDNLDTEKEIDTTLIKVDTSNEVIIKK